MALAQEIVVTTPDPIAVLRDALDSFAVGMTGIIGHKTKREAKYEAAVDALDAVVKLRDAARHLVYPFGDDPELILGGWRGSELAAALALFPTDTEEQPPRDSGKPQSHP